MGDCCCCCFSSAPNGCSKTFHKLRSGLCKLWKTRDSTIDGASYDQGQILPSSNLRIFTYLELESATENFKADGLLGDGGFGGVYKGLIDGFLVAVKKLNAESSQGFEEWESEVTFLGRLSHPNLVKLLGYCWEQNKLLLVYEYVPKGSLETHLFGRDIAATITEVGNNLFKEDPGLVRRPGDSAVEFKIILSVTRGCSYSDGVSSVPPLTWEQRLKIAIGAARGLLFLLNAKQVIYRDFKASNIVLDDFFNAKLSDFGLPRTRMCGYAVFTHVCSARLYVKNDVYGFGVVLVEILTGLRALDANRPSEQFSLVNWVTPFLSSRKKLRKVMDPWLKGKYPIEAALQTASLALKCLGLEPQTRPSVEEVLDTLMEIKRISEEL